MKNFLSLAVILFTYPLNAIAEEFLPKVPEGFSIAVFAEVENARQLAIAEDGTVFVGSRRSGKVWAVRDSNKDGYAEHKVLLAKSLKLPSGIAYNKGALYVAEVDQVRRFSNILKFLNSTEATKTEFPISEVIYSDLPNKKHHGWKFIAFDNNDDLFIPVGAPCNICNPDSKIFAHLRKLNIKTGVWSVIASGIRNTVGFDWHPETGKLWFSDNGRDWMGDDEPADELNRIDKSGQHFGYPFVHGNEVQDPEFYSEKPEQLIITKPALELQAHVAPLGLHFYMGKQFPKAFHNQLLVAEHGSWNRTKKVGFQVVLVTIDKDTVISNKPFISGFREGEKVLGRPVAFAELRDGSLLVSDDYAGKIYRVQFKSK